LCPRAHHPSPEFQALMVQNETETQWQERTGLLAAGYMDAWLIWQVPEEVTTCTASAGLNLTKVLSVPWDAHPPPMTASQAHVAFGRSQALAGLWRRLSPSSHGKGQQQRSHSPPGLQVLRGSTVPLRLQSHCRCSLGQERPASAATTSLWLAMLRRESEGVVGRVQVHALVVVERTWLWCMLVCGITFKAAGFAFALHSHSFTQCMLRPCAV
jgi:hypothetical protein